MSEKNSNNKKQTKKKKRLLIIESSSSSLSSSSKKSLKKEKEKEKKTRKKREKKEGKESVKKEKKLNDKTRKVKKLDRKLILVAATTSLSSSPELKEEKINIKESNDSIKMPSGRLNEKYIELMDKLAEIMMKQGEPFRARAYQKAQETIMLYPDDITSPEQLKGKPNIGSTIMEKLNEDQETGTLKVLEREKNNPVNILTDVYGIGPKKAKELVAQGITSISDLRANQNKLNDVQKVGLKYYEDILKRIPRSEIDQYASVFETAFVKASVDLFGKNGSQNGSKEKSGFEIVGSYRRGAENSGDIDVIITSETPKLFIQFINILIAEKVIIEVLSRGSTKCLVIAKIPQADSYRRVDFLYTSPEEYPFSVLYFTGSKVFNTVMRSQALKMGFTMNEHGLYKMEDNKKGEKVDHVFLS